MSDQNVSGSTRGSAMNGWRTGLTRGALTWVVTLLVLVAIGGAWYLRARPTASFRETIGTVGRPDAMSVEAIAEGGSSIVGRNVSIVDARVTQVTGDRTFWVAGSEGLPLLVVQDPAIAKPVRTRADERLLLNGVVREGSREGLSAGDQTQVKKANLYLVAGEILRTP